MKESKIQEYKQRVRELISGMTLDEKLRVLTTHHFASERLGLGEYYIGAEVARGFVGRDPETISTVFPQPTGLAGTFDKELMSELGKIAADEARAYYNKDKHGGIALWGPTVDMARDPRWGRNEEAYGEDPCLAGEMSAAYTETMLGDDGDFVKTIPTLKHFCADNNEENRGSCDAYLPLRLKYEYYYAPFECAIRKGGARSVMAAYNEINGCPAIMNNDIRNILKDEWGLWYVVSDGGDFSQTVLDHRKCETHSQALALSIRAGSDSMTDNDDLVYAAAKKALDNGEITESEIDASIACTLFSRFALGQFDECSYNAIDKSVVDCEAHKKVNLRAAREQMVLLKNNGILPIKGDPKRIAVLGALADENLMDWYTGYSSGDISVRQGITEKFGGSEIVYDSLWDIVAVKAPNGKYLSAKEDGKLIADADTVTDAEKFELQDWGENWNNLFSVKFKRYVRLFDDNSFRLHNRRIHDWFTRETLNMKPYCGRTLIEEFLHHRRMVCDENGELTVKKVTGVRSEQLFDIEVIENGRSRGERAAAECDHVIYCVGNHPVQVAKECYDRKTLALNVQPGMAGFLADINKNTILMIVSSYPYSIYREQEKLPAIIYTTHAGAYLGTAAAETLCGENNPAGRTSLTWYRSENDLPDILDYDIESAGTTYMYFKGTPLYPFGHGLSYSSFVYSGFTVSGSDDITAEVSVTNTSDLDGDEVVQIYFTMRASAVSRPERKLCGFERVHIRAGETKKVSVSISRDSLRIFNVRSRKMMVESGEYLFYAGASSGDIRSEAVLHIIGEEIGLRDSRFDAECFDSSNNFRISYSVKLKRHYICVKGWGGTALYKGVDLGNKKSLTIYASSVIGKGSITVDFGSGNTASVEVMPSMCYDDFSAYSVDVPENAGDTLVVSAGENVSVLEFVVV
ncbi:MAG: glycoside hydrolase family 3 C-terminal domain-containing protein [Huintestinicola sp.]